jgi:hypothetical protein
MLMKKRSKLSALALLDSPRLYLLTQAALYAALPKAHVGVGLTTGMLSAVNIRAVVEDPAVNLCGR